MLLFFFFFFFLSLCTIKKKNKKKKTKKKNSHLEQSRYIDFLSTTPEIAYWTLLVSYFIRPLQGYFYRKNIRNSQFSLPNTEGQFIYAYIARSAFFLLRKVKKRTDLPSHLKPCGGLKWVYSPLSASISAYEYGEWWKIILHLFFANSISMGAQM